MPRTGRGRGCGGGPRPGDVEDGAGAVHTQAVRGLTCCPVPPEQMEPLDLQHEGRRRGSSAGGASEG